MLRYTGHPFVDVGVATIVAYAGVDTLDQVKEKHFQALVEFILDKYINPSMANYLGTVVFANAYFGMPNVVSQPRFDSARREFLQGLLGLYHIDAPIPDAA